LMSEENTKLFIIASYSYQKKVVKRILKRNKINYFTSIEYLK